MYCPNEKLLVIFNMPQFEFINSQPLGEKLLKSLAYTVCRAFNWVSMLFDIYNDWKICQYISIYIANVRRKWKCILSHIAKIGWNIHDTALSCLLFMETVSKFSFELFMSKHVLQLLMEDFLVIIVTFVVNNYHGINYHRKIIW